METTDTFKKITELTPDIAGKWRARILINETDTIFLKFHKKPENSYVEVETGKYITNRLLQEAVEAREAK